MKKFGFMIVLFLTILISSLFVNAGISTDYAIENVEIDGLFSIPFSTYRAISIERGSSLPIEVWVRGINKINDVRVEVSLKGYEYGILRYESDIFDLDANTVKKVPLVLEIPEDLDASETYTIHVEISDKLNSVEEEHFVRVKEIRHLLNFLDVIFRPSSTVEAGRFLRTVVRAENLGAKDEKDIKVTISIPELGVSTRDFIDELVNNANAKGDDESSLSTNEILLQIPADAKEGDYEVRIDVDYNRGHNVATTKKTIHITGEKEAPIDESSSIISVDSTSQSVAQNKETTFKLVFANLGKDRILYSTDVVGTETWADSVVEPGFLSVGPRESGEMLIKLKVKEDALIGPKIFTLKVNSDNKPLKEINLNVGITEGSLNYGALGSVLEVLFALLIVVLVVLALVIAFRKIRSGREDGPGIETSSEQTYY
ncbi:hypothetical protein HYX16_02770 [Candidatus Woesearchaeota archaeon]|nr:hypothetical protein [Candidatus Woesearchaeota archaeon]